MSWEVWGSPPDPEEAPQCHLGCDCDYCQRMRFTGKWVAASKELPIEGVYVIAYPSPTLYTTEANYQLGGWRYTDSDGLRLCDHPCHVTHWMYPPGKPEGL